MFRLTVFEAMFVTHFIVDWLFQTKWEAINKARQWLPLSTHCLIYAAGFLPVFWWYGLSFWWLIFIFVTHFVLDRRVFERWWLEHVKRFRLGSEPTAFEWITLIGVDQTFHFVVLAVIALAA